jgi:hypothetical protein
MLTVLVFKVLRKYFRISVKLSKTTNLLVGQDGRLQEMVAQQR